MTREEAAKILQATRLMLMDGANQPISDLYYALDMAIEALKQMVAKTELNCSEKLNNCETCRFELYCPEMCEGCCEWDSHYEPKDEAQTDAYDSAKFSHNCIGMCENPKMYMAKVTDEPQMKQQIKRPWGMYIIEHPMYE